MTCFSKPLRCARRAVVLSGGAAVVIGHHAQAAATGGFLEVGHRHQKKVRGPLTACLGLALCVGGMEVQNCRTRKEIAEEEKQRRKLAKNAGVNPNTGEPANTSYTAIDPIQYDLNMVSVDLNIVSDGWIQGEGQLTVVERIGRGGFADVWRVKSLSTDDKEEFSVVKRINKDPLGFVGTPLHIWKNECELQMKCASEFIPKLLRRGASEDYYYIWMEFCENGSLGKLFRDNKSSFIGQEQRVKFVLKQAISAVKHLHSLNIVHCDIKPENFFVDSEGKLKLGDFGFAIEFTPDEIKEGHKELLMNQIAGTPAYMSPDILKQDPKVRYEYGEAPFTPSIDIYAVGISAYELMYGETPFSSEEEILKAEAKFPEITGKPSEAFITLVKKMLEKNPTERPTIDQILNDPYLKDFDAGKESPLLLKKLPAAAVDEKVESESSLKKA